MIGLVFLQGLFVLLQTYNIDPFTHSLENTSLDVPYGLSGSPNQSGLFFAVTAPLAFICPYIIPATLLGLFQAHTTSAWIGGICGILLVASQRSLKFLWVSLVILFALSLLFFSKFENISQTSVGERLQLYKHTTQAAIKGSLPISTSKGVINIKWNPWFGAGVGSFKKLSPHNQNIWINEGTTPTSRVGHRYKKAHNDYIEVFFECGILGLLLISSLIFNAVYRFIKAKKTKTLIIISSCLLAQLVSALGIFTVHTATSGMLLVIFYGLYLGETKC